MKAMKRRVKRLKNQRGFVLVYMAVITTALLLFTGLAVDSGRGYVVKAQLSKAVDGAALAAARALNSGDPAGEAGLVYRANFPNGYFGTTSSTNPGDTGFFNVTTDPITGRSIVHVSATAVLPTTFMSLGGFNTMTVASSGEATRRMVDLSLIVDVSGSIGSAWTTVADATRGFIDGFDPAHDRMSLTTFSNGALVRYQMPSSRGFDKTAIKAAVPGSLPGGSTNMDEGLWRGWDELRSVSAANQSTLRVIVLFTDGASNGVPGQYTVGGPAGSLRTADFPKNLPDPDNMTWWDPQINGLYGTASDTSGNVLTCAGVTVTGCSTLACLRANTQLSGTAACQRLPVTSYHPNGRAGTSTQFALSSGSLKVNGVAQNVARPFQGVAVGGKYPAYLTNINNAARNLLEIIADAARNDNSGAYRIRIYTIGMGALVKMNLGYMPETPESMLMRIANDKDSLDFQDFETTNQLEGKYFYAANAAAVEDAYAGILNEIVRLSK
jgi:Flp pilus assembly protein TadG